MTDKDKLSREDLRADRAAPPRRGTFHRILVLVAVLAGGPGGGAPAAHSFVRRPPISMHGRSFAAVAMRDAAEATAES